MNKKIKSLLLILLIMLIPLSLGFTTTTSKLTKPQKVYRVYLKGKYIGLIESKSELEKYINRKEEEVKKKYNVDKVYTPKDLEIKQEYTYNNNIYTVEEIYEKIKDISPLTINGYRVRIGGVTKTQVDSEKVKTDAQTIYVIDKDVFTNSAVNTAKAFITSDLYDAYANKTQAEIKETGSLIENIYIKNKISISKQRIPIDKKIYLDEEELSKYLLFGTTEEQSNYVVQPGDTIEKVAFNNQMSTEELMIANNDITDVKTLLYPGQNLKVGIVQPQVDVVEEDYIIKDEDKQYTTETQEDPNQYTDYQEVRQAGANGKNRVTQQIQKVNGVTVNTVTIETKVLKEPIKEIIVKGTKRRASAAYGSPVAISGNWGWPATCGSPSSISSGYGYRWGSLHDGNDIAGCGYGSAIFAANAGTVKESGYHSINGQYIVIDHHNGIYTYYGHLSQRYVSQNDTVSKGQVIGAMGNTGVAYGVHLHFGAYSGYPLRYGSGGNSFNSMALYS